MRRAIFGGGATVEEDAGPVEVDGVLARNFIQLADDQENGFVVKVSGDDTSYGKGQAFMVLEAGEGDATDNTAAGSVLFRVDAKGGVGITGGLHVAAGLRHAFSGAAVWIDPAVNVIPLVIHNPSVAESAVWDQPYAQIIDVRSANKTVFKIAPNYDISTAGNVIVRETDASQVLVGAVFGLPGIGFGTLSDAILVRTAAGIIGVFDAFEFSEKAAPAAPAANKVRLYSKDNGAGKTQLCAKFNTGAEVVIATQP